MKPSDPNKQITGVYGYEKSEDYGMQDKRPPVMFWLWVSLGFVIVLGLSVLDFLGY